MKKVLITGSAGFVGFHLSSLLLQLGYQVYGIDSLSDYYDVNLKIARHEVLKQHQNFQSRQLDIRQKSDFISLGQSFEPDVIVHLAAQAGVRYSIDQPGEYIDTNIVGTFNVLELARSMNTEHLLMASTSSVYGANTEMPFSENLACDTPMSIYAATKLSTEALGHSYAHLFNLPITMFRFFTVYGPWGRPDMALFKFAAAMEKGDPIEIYGEGKMARDFTYVEDLVQAISLLIKCVPEIGESAVNFDSKSPIAPYRRVNIGNSSSVGLMQYIEALEQHMGIQAKKIFLPMQQGDVRNTLADTRLLHELTGYKPSTNYIKGVSRFVDWFREYNGA